MRRTIIFLFSLIVEYNKPSILLTVYTSLFPYVESHMFGSLLYYILEKQPSLLLLLYAGLSGSSPIHGNNHIFYSQALCIGLAYIFYI